MLDFAKLEAILEYLQNVHKENKLNGLIFNQELVRRWMTLKSNVESMMVTLTYQDNSLQN